MRAGFAAALLLGSMLAFGAAAEPAQVAQLSIDRLLPVAPRDRPAMPEGGVPFAIRFTGAARGLEPGAAVEINGIRVGGVRGVGLDYDVAARRFVVAAEILLQPEALPPIDGRRARTPEGTIAAIDGLVRAGMRARLGSTRPLGGDALVTLSMMPEAPAAVLGRAGTLPEIPTGPSRADEAADRIQDLLERLSRAPVEQMIADLQEAMAALKALATGPELREPLAELRTQIARLGARTDPILNSLNETVRGANRTIASIDRQFGERSPMLAEIHVLLRELTGAARSMRLMADYLERNPDALLRGKSDSRR
jgi:paraquat-inducible protein B